MQNFNSFRLGTRLQSSKQFQITAFLLSLLKINQSIINNALELEYIHTSYSDLALIGRFNGIKYY